MLKKLLAWLKPKPVIDFKEFRNAFGERACPICSYARFGYREFGLIPNPKPHKCPEQDDRDYRGNL